MKVLLILSIDYTPLGTALFGTAPIPLAVWQFILPFAVLLLGLEESRKWLIRYFLKPSTACIPHLRHEPAQL